MDRFSEVPSKKAITSEQRWWSERVKDYVCSGRALVGALVFVSIPASSRFCLHHQHQCHPPPRDFHTRSNAITASITRKSPVQQPKRTNSYTREKTKTDQTRLCVFWLHLPEVSCYLSCFNKVLTDSSRFSAPENCPTYNHILSPPLSLFQPASLSLWFFNFVHNMGASLDGGQGLFWLSFYILLRTEYYNSCFWG